MDSRATRSLAAALALAAGLESAWAVESRLPPGQGPGGGPRARLGVGLPWTERAGFSRTASADGLPQVILAAESLDQRVPAQPPGLPLPETLLASPQALAPKPASPGLAELQVLARTLGPQARLSQDQGAGSEEAHEAFGEFWDGETEWATAGGEALVLRRQETKEEARHAHAELPILEHGLKGFNEALAREFLERRHSFGEGSDWTGRQLLLLLMTEEALDTGRTPDIERLDMSQFGRSDAEIRAILNKKGIPVFRYHDFMNAAFRRGLLYRVNARKLDRTFHGVPALIRRTFDLTPPETPGRLAAAGQAPGSEARPSAFSEALSGLVGEAMAWPVKDELFEFTAQLAESALAAKKIDVKQVQALRDRAPGLTFEVSSLASALITLLDSSKGTLVFDRVLDLCQRAVGEGLLKRRELDVEELLAGPS